MSWIGEMLCEYITDKIAGTIKLFGDKINNIFFTMVDYGTSNEYVQSAENFLVVFALTAIAILVGKQVLDTDLIETRNSDEEPIDLIVRIAETVAVISCTGEIFNYLLKLAKSFSTDMLKNTDAKGVKGITEGLVNIDISNLGGEGIIYLNIVLLLVVGYCVFTVVSGLRGAEIIAMKLFTPLFALDLLNVDRERWDNFFIGYLLAFMSYSIQVLFFLLSIKSYASASINDMGYCFSAVAWLLAAICGPHFLEKYMHKTGLTKAAGSGLRMVAQTVVLKAV